MAGQLNSSGNMSDGDNKWLFQHSWMTRKGNSSVIIMVGDNVSAVLLSCKFYLFIIDTVVMGTIIFGGVIGNSLAFVVFWKDNIKTSASFFFQSLALVDSTLLLLSIPLFSLHSFVVYTNWLNGYLEIYAYVHVYILPLALTVQTASIWYVVLFAVNRYIAVCFPLKSIWLCTISKVKKQLAFVLLAAVLYNIPRFAEYRTEYVNYDGKKYKPYAVPTKLGTQNLYYMIYDSALYFTFIVALPIFTLTYVNIRLIQVLKVRRLKRTEMVNQRLQNDNNVTVVLIIVVVVLIICQVPAFVGKALLNVSSKNAQLCGGYHFYLRPVANTLVVLNSAVNFVIYVLFNKRFRHVLSQTVGWCSVREVDGLGQRSMRRLPLVFSCGNVSQENNNDSNVEETRL